MEKMFTFSSRQMGIPLYAIYTIATLEINMVTCSLNHKNALQFDPVIPLRRVYPKK